MTAEPVRSIEAVAKLVSESAVMDKLVEIDGKIDGMLTAVQDILDQVQPAVEMISSNPLFSMLLGKKKTHE
jgi:hypothetical protein